MTLYQIQIYLREDKDLGPGNRVVSGAEWRRIKKRMLKREAKQDGSQTG